MARREEELRWPEDRSSLRVMNREVRRVEAPDKVSGRARYKLWPEVVEWLSVRSE